MAPRERLAKLFGESRGAFAVALDAGEYRYQEGEGLVPPVTHRRTMRKKFIAGNWKMYTTAATAKALAESVANGVTDNAVTVAVCPPFPWLGLVADAVKASPVAVGGQNCHYAAEGAYTGEVSPGMLLDAGCRYVIIGHSERRHGQNEPDRFLNLKAKAATAAGLSVIFCVGELLSEREAGMTEDVIWFQVAAGLNGLTPEAVSKLVIAYEP